MANKTNLIKNQAFVQRMPHQTSWMESQIVRHDIKHKQTNLNHAYETCHWHPMQLSINPVLAHALETQKPDNFIESHAGHEGRAQTKQRQHWEKDSQHDIHDSWTYMRTANLTNFAMRASEHHCRHVHLSIIRPILPALQSTKNYRGALRSWLCMLFCPGLLFRAMISTPTPAKRNVHLKCANAVRACRGDTEDWFDSQ
jgi:hypothetical protein